ncbi:hypothetical protein LX36DRAFT_713286 [Colletotrichum falcatum]|nr:hypothetical protein LX36DRAFT_713286 [Colletotrichum falcatum]
MSVNARERTPSSIKKLRACQIEKLEDADCAFTAELRKKDVVTVPGKPFKQSATNELKGLMDRGVFDIVKYEKEVHSGSRIFQMRLVCGVKGKNEQSYEKSRLPAALLKGVILARLPLEIRDTYPKISTMERACEDLQDFSRVYIGANNNRVTAATKPSAHSG